jgi:hypothetical protein
MADLIHVGSVLHVTDEFFVCEDCEIEVRVPARFQTDKTLPSIHAVMKEHDNEGHHCYARSKSYYWPPKVDRKKVAQKHFLATLREAGVENEADYCV